MHSARHQADSPKIGQPGSFSEDINIRGLMQVQGHSTGALQQGTHRALAGPKQDRGHGPPPSHGLLGFCLFCSARLPVDRRTTFTDLSRRHLMGGERRLPW